MAKKKADLAVKVGEYEQNGKKKGRFVNVGAIMTKDDGGEFILLNRTFNPAGVPNPDNKDSIILSRFDSDKDKNGDVDEREPRPATSAPAGNGTIDDAIPFMRFEGTL